ncbi:MAG: bifunctional metallophosphatase/5'-nucleotidase, partial [Ottowia sp.]|nr:bifunctional metallophosphatase/5'-nucleotidase [Ottowia sp.]
MKHSASAICLAAAALLAGCAGTLGTSPKSAIADPDLVIAHANDTHSYIAGRGEQGVYCTDAAPCTGGYARMAAEIKRVKAQYPGRALALHAGDTFQGTLFFSVHRWPMLGNLDALMPWDASTPGNHEYDEGCEALAQYVPQLPFPVLAANLQRTAGTPLEGAGIKPYIVREVGGHKVGVIGLSNDGSDVNLRCPELPIGAREQVVRDAVQQLQAEGVQRIIALTHIGITDDRKLARSVDGLDIVVGGHTHTYLGEGSEDGPYPIVEHSPNGDPVLVVTAGSATRWLGELAIKFDDKGVPVQWSGQAVPLAPDMPRDPTLDAKVSSYADELAYLRADVIGSHSTKMNDGLDECRVAECFSALLLTDAMLEWGRQYGAQIAFTNSGGVRAPILPGTVTRGDVLNAFPFAGHIYVREFSGAQVLAALEHGARGEGDENHIGKVGGPRMLQPAGLRYTADEARQPGQR